MAKKKTPRKKAAPRKKTPPRVPPNLSGNAEQTSEEDADKRFRECFDGATPKTQMDALAFLAGVIGRASNHTLAIRDSINGMSEQIEDLTQKVDELRKETDFLNYAVRDEVAKR